jgi:carboxymethylenebutenolidase
MRQTLPSGTPVEVASPAGPPRRGLVLIPDIGGLRPLFDDLVVRLARDYSWAVAAVEPFPGQDLPTIEDRFAAVPHLDDDAFLADLRAAAELLGTQPVAVLGFCMGGMYTYKAAGTGVFDKAVSFYGMIRVPPAWEGPGQRQPLDYLRSPEVCPVLSIIGGADPYTPDADVAELRTLPNVAPVVYPGADHGFVHDASRPAHRAEDAADAWHRVEAFLAT